MKTRFHFLNYSIKNASVHFSGGSGGDLMGKQLTAQQEREIRADYCETNSAKETGRRFGVSDVTVANVMQRNQDAKQIIEQTKQKQEDRLREYIADQTPKVQTIITQLLDKLCDDETVKKANLLQTATTLGIVLDKFAPNQQQCGPVAIQINFGGNPANSGDNFG